LTEQSSPHRRQCQPSPAINTWSVNWIALAASKISYWIQDSRSLLQSVQTATTSVSFIVVEAVFTIACSAFIHWRTSSHSKA
jgi:hypothetical protein